MKIHRLLTLLLLALACQLLPAGGFVSVENGRLMRDGRPYKFIGANFWYGPILASEGRGGDRGRLCRELDRMQRLGINNLRILVGADGEEGTPDKISPVLQRAPGRYNDTLLAGLDYLLREMGRRGMLAVLYLNNAWEWSGGYGYYLERAGAGKSVLPNRDGYDNYVSYAALFATNTEAHRLFFDHVSYLLGRTNRYTGRAYRDDPTIMSWQICNEPRAFSLAALPAFEDWLRRTAALIRRLAPHQLISVGSEGAYGCENDMDSYERIGSDPNIDYLNIHVWPANWGWARRDSLTDHLARACLLSRRYIERHLPVCRRLGKPLVMEEFGYLRDGYRFAPGSPVTARNAYYRYMFALMDSIPELAGINFWAWGGEGRPSHERWQPGDAYVGDPAQEPQGLYSVFDSDRQTLKIIRRAVRQYCR